MARNITQLAQLSGQPAKGQALLARLEREVGVVRHLAAQAEPGLLLMAVNERILPNAPGSRFGFLFDVLGARSALRAQDLPARGTVYDLDAVARLDPAWIYVIDRNAATGSAPGGGALIPSQQVFDNAQVRGTQAGRKGQVVFLDPKGWYLLGSAGPTALLRLVDMGVAVGPDQRGHCDPLATDLAHEIPKDREAGDDGQRALQLHESRYE